MYLDSHSLCYDRQTPNGDFMLRKRMIESLPSKPSVKTINLFEMTAVAKDEEKQKVLKEKLGLWLQW